MRTANESTGYIRREGFGLEMDFGPMVLDFGPMTMVLKRIACEHKCMFHCVTM